ncbi:MAG: HDOD domain-containing protein [Terracidiphilus sp.]
MQTETKTGLMVATPWAHLRLPPFPQVAVRVMQLANDENVQLHQLCDLISTDPAFACEVLTIANSMLYAPRFPASSILQAVAVLGANHLQGLCITVGVRSYLGKNLRFPSLRDVWRHNLACAMIAQRLAAPGFIDKESAYTAGILHDIGRFALAVIQPREYALLLERHRGSPAAMLDGERELFGWDHCETGRQLIADWKLPPEFNEAVSDHHAPRQSEGPWNLTELVKVSCRMADAAGYPAFPGCETAPYADLLEVLPARERRLFFPEVEPLAAEIAQGIQAIESV